MEVSEAAGRLRLDAERVRTTRFMRGPWWGGLDPQEVYGFLGWVAEELDLRAHELSQARAEAERANAALRHWQTRNARTGWSSPPSGTGAPVVAQLSGGPGEVADNRAGRISDELAAHYRETMLAHADDPILGACPRCRRSRCDEWRWAYERLVVAGRLGDL